MISYHRDSEMHDGSRCYKWLKICIFDSMKYGRNLCPSNHSTFHGNPAFLKEYHYPIISLQSLLKNTLDILLIIYNQ